jgi:ADP-ribosylglycohydrolase
VKLELSDSETLLALLKDEIVQREEEGCKVEKIREALNRLGHNASDQQLEVVYRRLENLSPSLAFAYVEPSDLDGIRHLRREGAAKSELNLTDDQLYEKIYGAWLGRCAGCMLGKPTEGWSKQRIQRYLELSRSYPLTNYVPEVVPHPPGFEMNGDAYENALLGRITCAARDDDLDYMAINLQVLEQFGFSFSTNDIAETWLARMPYKMTYTAERVAYRNLVNNIKPPQSAVYRNPYREWIGAQIRADVWGYVAPGNPEFAATLAYRDASLSHVKNGIYGEMLVAAMVSAAFTTNNVDEIVRAGLSQIPVGSRLAEAVRDVIKWKRECPTWTEAWGKVNSKYGSYSWIHTLNNAALVLLGLLYAESDFEKGITVSVMAGLDTDCNGATCGSILGAALGSSRLPRKWIRPLNDRIKTAVFGFLDCHISELAKRTLSIANTTRVSGKPRHSY